jgi:magnesium-transporting ATPase (P-type)
MISETVTAALVMAAGGLAVWWWALEVAGLSEGESRNLVLLVMVLFENVHAVNARSEATSAFRVPLRRNPVLVIGVLSALGVHIAALYLAPVQAVLGTMPVPLDVAAALAAVALVLLAVVEVAKALRRRREGTMAT